MSLIRLSSLLAASLAGSLLGCSDPVHDHAVERLGPESVRGTGPLHRAGQSCGTCHGPLGPARQDFAVAGTVFVSATSWEGASDATVDLVDSRGSSPSSLQPIVTNCAGNFWVARSDWAPVFPVRVKVTKNGVERVMKTVIGGSASCADCHEARISNPLARLGAVALFDGVNTSDAGSTSTPGCSAGLEVR